MQVSGSVVLSSTPTEDDTCHTGILPRHTNSSRHERLPLCLNPFRGYFLLQYFLGQLSEE